MTSLKHTFTGLGHLALNVMFPPRCPACDAAVEVEGNVCPACFEKLTLIAAPYCECCGIPFVVSMGADTQCPECLTTPPAFAKARAAMVYDAVTAPMISALKFHDQWAGVPRYVALMQSAGAPLLHACDVIVPVPLHWRRLIKRKYNQAALLAYALSKASGKACLIDVLKKVAPTVPQMRLNREQRLKNVRRAFAVTPQARSNIEGKTILLVDDVVTTGATVDACARVLRDGGAACVHVLALARTVKA